MANQFGQAGSPTTRGQGEERGRGSKRTGINYAIEIATPGGAGDDYNSEKPNNLNGRANPS